MNRYVFNVYKGFDFIYRTLKINYFNVIYIKHCVPIFLLTIYRVFTPIIL